MKDADISLARSALTEALNVAGPILTALQQAEQVFGVLQNTEKHRKALAAEVAALQKAIPDAKAAKESAEAHIAAVKAEVAVAEADADERINATITYEAARIAEAKRASAEAIAAAQANAQKIQAECDQATSEVVQVHSAAMAEMTAKEKELSDSIAALEKKLATLRANAAKFAAALTVE